MAAPAAQTILKLGSLSYTALRALCSTGLGPPHICWAFTPITDAIVGGITLGGALQMVSPSNDGAGSTTFSKTATPTATFRSTATYPPFATFSPFANFPPTATFAPIPSRIPTIKTVYATVTATMAPAAAPTPTMEPALIALLTLMILAILILTLNSRPWSAR